MNGRGLRLRRARRRARPSRMVGVAAMIGAAFFWTGFLWIVAGVGIGIVIAGVSRL